MNTKLITNGIPVADATGHVTTTSFSELAKQVCELMGMQIVDKAGELTFVAGGRNLLPDSEKEIGHEISGLQDEYISYGSEWTNMRIFDEHGIGRFTLSFEARSIGKAGRLNVYSTPGEPEAFKYTFQQCAIDLTNEWKRYAVPINVILRNPDSNRTALSFFGAPYGSGIVPHIRKIKLERGNVATDWTPAPEDLEKRLDILENRGG